MAWRLEVWWGYSSECSRPGLKEEFDTKAEGVTRTTEVLADGHTVSDPGRHQHFPPGGITYVDLYEFSEEE
jgi:hypothetical protein